MNSNLQRVKAALESVVCRPEHDAAELATFFSANYQQCVDGITLGYPEFVDHMATLKRATHRVKLAILAAAADGEHVLTHHQVEVVKPDGSTSTIEVQAHFTLRNDLIWRCDELTRLVRGDVADGDLGSRTSA